MATQLFANNASSTLASGITNSATTLTLATGQGALFPSPTGGDWFLLTLTQATGVESSWEIVKCTSRSGDVLTIVRAQESTTAAAWSAGAKAEARVTAGSLIPAVAAGQNGWLLGSDKTKLDALSGTNSGDNAVNSLYSGLVSNATHTGDVSGATILTLAAIITAAGPIGSAWAVPVITFDAKGRLTAVSSATITPAAIGAQAAGTYATGTGSASGTNTGDETTATIKTKLGITTLSGSNTGDQTLPTTLPASDVYAWAKAATKPSYAFNEIASAAVSATTGTFSGAVSVTSYVSFGQRHAEGGDVRLLGISGEDGGWIQGMNDGIRFVDSAWTRTNFSVTNAGVGFFYGAISASNFSGSHSGTHSGASSGTNTGDQTNISGYAGSLNSTTWCRAQTSYGYIDLGPANATWAHIYTDRPAFYFNQNLYVNGTQVVTNSGSWAISVTGSSASCTGNAATATYATTAGGTSCYTSRTDAAWYQAVWRSPGDTNLYSTHMVSIYSGGYGKIAFNSNSWTLEGHASYGIYSNTGLYAAGGLWDAGNRVYSAGNPQGSVSGSSGSCSGNAATATRANGAPVFWSSSHPVDYYLVNNWTGAHWQITSNHSAGVRVAYADSAGSAPASGGTSAACSGNAASATYAYNCNSWFYFNANYGHGVVGLYHASYFQGVFAMGDAYKLGAGGDISNLYGICWSHPNAGGIASNLDSHGLIVAINGGFGSCMSYSIKASGNVTAYSDERLKRNWRDLDGGFVSQLAGVKTGIYDRIDMRVDAEGGAIPVLTQVGVSAQSLRLVLPNAVQEADDDMKTLSVAYGNAALASCVMLARKAVNHEERIRELEAEIVWLKAA